MLNLLHQAVADGSLDKACECQKAELVCTVGGFGAEGEQVYDEGNSDASRQHNDHELAENQLPGPNHVLFLEEADANHPKYEHFCHVS